MSVTIFAVSAIVLGAVPGGAGSVQAAPVAAGSSLKVNVPQAVGGKTVIGQLTVAGVTGGGFVTAYACSEGIPRDGQGNISKSDLNYDGTVSQVASNRLIVKADSNGDVCFYTSSAAAMIVDVNGVSDTGIVAVPNQRTDTRTQFGLALGGNHCGQGLWFQNYFYAGGPVCDSVPPAGFGKGTIGGGGFLKVNVPAAVGGKTVIGQLTVAGVTGGGFVTAYGCADGIPRNGQDISKSDLNYDGNVNPVASNRLIVKADSNGDVCFYTYLNAEMIVDINGVSDTGIVAVPNQRTDTRTQFGLALGGNHCGQGLWFQNYFYAGRPVCDSVPPAGFGKGTIGGGGFLKVNVPAAVGGKTVIGQLTVAGVTGGRLTGGGFVTAYGCADGIPRNGQDISKSDLNYDGNVNPVASNRLIVKADSNGDVCFYTYLNAEMIVDINGVADTAITSFANQRTDTRQTTT